MWHWKEDTEAPPIGMESIGLVNTYSPMDSLILWHLPEQNVVADALSRKDEDVEALLCAISIIQPDWINEAREEWKNDEEVWELIRKLQQDSSTSDTFSWKNDSLWYKDRLYLCKHSPHKPKNKNIIPIAYHHKQIGKLVPSPPSQSHYSK